METTRINNDNELVYFAKKTFVHNNDQDAWWDFMDNWDDSKKFHCLEDAVNWINENLLPFTCDTMNIAVYENDYIIPLIPCDEGDRTDDDVEYCALSIVINMKQIENNNN